MQNRKLNNSTVKAVRNAFSDYPSYNAAAKIVGIDPKSVSNIVQGLTYTTNTPKANAKLTLSQARSIRNWFVEGPSFNAVARFIGVDAKTVANIVNGRTYQDVN